MINQQLLDFIKSQLLKGLDKETIKKELLGNGWAEVDIQEGFNAVSAPVVNPTINPVVNPIINPVVSTSLNNPILTQNTNHSSKKVLLIILAFFIIAGGVSGYYFRNDIPVVKDFVKNDGGYQTLLNNDNFSNGTVINNKETGVLTEDQKIICGKSPDQKIQAECIIKQALQSSDIKTCDLFNKLDFVGKNEYKDTCYLYIVNNNKNKSVCEMILDINIKDKCYSQLAILTKDITICGTIKNTENQKDCYEKTIIVNNNIDSCKLLKDTYLNNYCYEKTAINLGNIINCKIIPTSLGQFNCIYTIDPSKVTSTLCDNLSNEYFANESKRGFCYSVIASKNKDIDMCKNITENSEYNGCLYDLIRNKTLLDIKICDMFKSDTDNNLKNSCIRDIAVYAKNKQFCELQVLNNNKYYPDEIKAIIDSCKSRVTSSL